MGGSEQDAIEETVLGYLHAHETQADRFRFCSGSLRRYQECADARSILFDRWESAVAVESLAVVDVGAEAARADLIARWTVSRENGGVADRFSTDFSGPVHLRWIEGDWRIVDHMRNGSSLADRIIEHDTGWQESGDVRMLPLVSRRDARLLQFYFKIATDGPSLWGWECIARGRPISFRPSVLFPAIDLDPGLEALVGSVVRISSSATNVDIALPLFDRKARRWRNVRMSLPLRAA